ncbi:MAG TPA: S8 family serine peptidase [Azospirillaceae bacterium]|nr:S8 family serine peptidase [Azospirillaceae bacterium]
MAPPNDPLFSSQYWLSDRSGTGIQTVWQEYSGKSVSIGFVDTGIDYANPEFAGRIDTFRDYDVRDRDFDANSPTDARSSGEAGHGATVLPTLAGAMDNGVGGAGVAHEAIIVPYRMSPRSQRTPEQEAFLTRLQQYVDVSQNAWSYSGEYFRDNFAGTTFADSGRAIVEAVTEGRDGRGTILVRSAGNAGQSGDDVAAHNYQNNRYSITVAAADVDGRPQDVSTGGAALLLSAPNDFTSGASAVVTGVVAMMLQANNSLGWRDVQDILAATARPTDIGNGTWLVNGATNWNGGGMLFSRDVGFGQVDARAAVRLAEGWTSVSTSANERVLQASARPGLAIPDNNGNGVSSSVTITGALDVDRAEVTLDIPHSRAGDLEVYLTSPSGARIALYDRLGNGSASGPIQFTTTANAFRGETGQGTWTLTVVDRAAGNTGTLAGWTLKVTGDTASANTRHIYTDTFGAVAGGSRSVLSDGAGIDTLDASAVSGTVFLNLNAGQTSTIAGRGVTIAAGTVIEHARGGDGDDVIVGNSADNLLVGNRGNDTFDNGPGNDTFDGGSGTDVVRLSGLRSQYSFTRSTDGTVRVTGPDGVDILREIETVSFNDNTTLSLTGPIMGVNSNPTEGADSLEGTANADTINGGGGNDRIFGLAGNDSLVGGDGDDFIDGGTGSDTLRGEGGNDTLYGGLDYDVIDGGEGDDFADFGHREVAVVDLSKGTARFPTATVGGTEQLANVENVLGTKGTDTIIGAANNNILDGREGDDVLQGLQGNDTITGGAGNDTAVFVGKKADYDITNANGTITVVHKNGGSDGTDTLTGIERLRFSDETIDAPGTGGGGGTMGAQELYLQTAGGDVVAWNAPQGSNGFKYVATFDPNTVKFLGTGDFDNDMKTDFLLQSGGTTVSFDPELGANGFKEVALNGGTIVASGNLQSGGGDELLVQNGRDLSFLSVADGKQTGFVTLNEGFKVLGAGQIDGQGTSDIVIQDGNTGGTLFWNGSEFKDLITLSGGQEIKAIGNFTGDAADDFLFYNTNSRTLIFWDQTQGGNGFKDFITLTEGWSVVGTGDINGDGRDDVVIKNDTSGAGIYWDGSKFQDLGTVLSGVTLVGLGEVG